MGLAPAAGKHSGRNALRTKLQSLGFDLAQEQLDDVFKRFKVGAPAALPRAQHGSGMCPATACARCMHARSESNAAAGALS